MTDPFVQLSLGTDKPVKSRTIQKNLNPIWGGDEFRLTVKKEGDISDWRLSLAVMDRDSIGRNDALGSLELDIGSILSGDTVRLHIISKKGRNKLDFRVSSSVKKTVSICEKF